MTLPHFLPPVVAWRTTGAKWSKGHLAYGRSGGVPTLCGAEVPEGAEVGGNTDLCKLCMKKHVEVIRKAYEEMEAAA